MAAPTHYAELNDVLQELVAEVQTVLGDNFCGAYLQGSFALGSADEYSDVDFIVAIDGELTEEQLARLQQMHKRMYGLESAWAQHLEGSYVPKAALRRVDAERSPYWYLDNGSSELVQDNHCNTAVVRWTLREHGIVLAGPEPASLVEPVTPAQLRTEALQGMDEFVAWANYRASETNRWKQPYLVLTFCRLLHTIEVGVVASKRQAGEWALQALDPEWASLIQQALDDRPDPWKRVHQSADPELTARTLEFADYAASSAAAATR